MHLKKPSSGRRGSTDAFEGAFLRKEVITGALEGAFLRKEVITDALEGAFLRKEVTTDAFDGAFLRKELSTDAFDGAFPRKEWSSRMLQRASHRVDLWAVSCGEGTIRGRCTDDVSRRDTEVAEEAQRSDRLCLCVSSASSAALRFRCRACASRVAMPMLGFGSRAPSHVRGRGLPRHE